MAGKLDLGLTGERLAAEHPEWEPAPPVEKRDPKPLPRNPHAPVQSPRAEAAARARRETEAARYRQPPIPPWEGITEPNFTTLPNQLVDVLMPLISGDEWTLVTVIVRHTFGFRHAEAYEPISIADFCRRGGLSKGKVIRGLSRLTAAGVLEKMRRKHSKVGHQATGYRLKFRV